MNSGKHESKFLYFKAEQVHQDLFFIGEGHAK